VRFSLLRRISTSVFAASLAVVTMLSAATGAPYSADVTWQPGMGDPRTSHDCNDPLNPLVNCSFETGDFGGWVATDIPGPFWPLQVVPAGISPGFDLFPSTPTEGQFAAVHGFDGDGPGTISIAQDVILPLEVTTLEFDYRAGWDMFNFPGSTQPRTFTVHVEPFGGGAPLQSDLVLTADPGSINLDTGPLKGLVVLAAFAGAPVRINFECFIPEAFTGPGHFQLDNVLVNVMEPISVKATNWGRIKASYR
jgi:hypothetical protein